MITAFRPPGDPAGYSPVPPRLSTPIPNRTRPHVHSCSRTSMWIFFLVAP